MDKDNEQLTADVGAAQPDAAPASGGTPQGGEIKMKLDFKRTLFVGFAFMGIMCFWEVYDYIMPLILNRVYGLNATEYGLIMGLDNLLAIFLLPFFGSLSDKATGAKYGRRTTFIVIGTLGAIIFMIVMIVIENVQYQKVMDLDITSPQVLVDAGYLAPEAWNADVRSLWQQIEAAGMSPDSIDSVSEFVSAGSPQYQQYGAFLNRFFDAQYAMAADVTKQNPGIIIGFIAALLLVLVSMASYRSPAIALMPDVTPKPLRSQANALITLMGGAGGLASIILYTLLAKERYQSHIALFVTLAAVMAVMLAAFLLTVREKRFVAKRFEEEKAWGVVDEEEVASYSKLPKAKVISLILILATVFLWFFGWNAIKSHLSTYATNVLKFDDGFVGIINILNGAGGAIALLPVALMASKLGRKKTILIGVVIAVCAFIPCIFLSDTIEQTVLKIAFTACFLIAGFGLVIINVNTLPMVTELAKGSNVGKYTGYYYVASMTAQAITPMIAGAIMEANPDNENLIFVYGVCCIAACFVTMFFTKHGDNKPERKKKMVEYFGEED